MTAPQDAPPVIMVNVPTDVKKAEERLAHYHPEHHHFYEPTKVHTGKRLLRIVIAGTGFMADSYDLFVINIGKSPPIGPTKHTNRHMAGGRVSAPAPGHVVVEILYVHPVRLTLTDFSPPSFSSHPPPSFSHLPTHSPADDEAEQELRRPHS